MTTQSGLTPQFNTYDQQKCFIAYTHKASWSEDILAACTEVLPHFGLEAWYADDQFEPGRSLKEKVVEMIANARYGIFDLSAMYDNERHEWVMPRNVLIELGIAIALNRPVLLLRTKENRMRGYPLPTCLTGIADIIEFSGEPTLKRALEEHIPQWMNVSPEQMWWTRACLFGNRVCEYREIHPRMERWQHEGLHCHIADGPDTDRPDFRETIEEQIKRYNDLTFDYLDACKPTHPYHFMQCAHCQEVRSSQFAIYRITPQTDAETYIAIGMSIALETQFGYEIPKIFFTADVHEVPSLLSGYEVIEAVNTKARKLRLRKALPVVMQRVQECAWNPQVLPFEVVLPVVHSFHVREVSEVVEEEHVGETSQPVVFHRQLRSERLSRGWSHADLAEKLGLDNNPRTVRRWERGESLPRPYYRKKLCGIFGKSLEELGLIVKQDGEEMNEEAEEERTVAKWQPVVFHEQLKSEQLLHRWSHADLADKIGLANPRSIRRWERGESLPQPYYRKKLCEIFGKSLEELGLIDKQNGEEQSGETQDNPFNEMDSESYSGLQLEPLSRSVWIDGSQLSKLLPPKEFKLLEFLAEHAGKVCSRGETNQAVYDERYVPHRDNARLDALIERTRLHIGDNQRNPRFIETVRGVGYRLHEYIGKSPDANLVKPFDIVEQLLAKDLDYDEADSDLHNELGPYE